jgi:hypothetical protein
METDMKRTFLVTLADHATGKDQRILVRCEHSEGMQEFVQRKDLDPPLEISDPVVIGIKELRTKRPLPRTTMSSFIA